MRNKRPVTPAERQQKRIAAWKSWLNTPDPSRRTAPARAAADARFERKVDPQGKLPPKERRRLAELERRLFYAELSRKGIEARRRRNGRAGTKPRKPSGDQRVTKAALQARGGLDVTSAERAVGPAYGSLSGGGP